MSDLIHQNIPLSDKNWFKTGGKAKYFSQPQNNLEFQESLNFASLNNLNVFMLGEGANILISDDGFDGLVINPKLDFIKVISENETHAVIQAGSGLSFATLIDWCLENNFSGLEEFSGIPGTVGGSVYINIHYYDFLLSDFLIQAEVIDKSTGQFFNVNKDWFKFGYNQSTLQNQNYYLVSANFLLKKLNNIEVAYAKGRSKEIIRHRAKRYPASNTCGSFFRNFYESEVSLTQNQKKIIFVAYYLDKIGVKGELCVNQAAVSYQHANMIVNLGGAKTSDIVNLARKMQELVMAKFGILAQPECQLIGFTKNPLL